MNHNYKITDFNNIAEEADTDIVTKKSYENAFRIFRKNVDRPVYNQFDYYLVMKNEYDIDYYDDGKKKLEVLTAYPSNVTTYMQYDEAGKRTEKIVERGTVKTYYDENDKPIKRETDRGSGIIVTEDLSGK